MKKVLTAVNHPALNEFFRKNCPELLIEKDDICSQEDLLKLIKTDIPDVLVLNDELPGKYDNKILIEKIRKIDKYFKIVIIVSFLDQTYRKFLYSNGIFDILVNDNAQIADLVEVVENEGRVVVKIEKEIPKQVKDEIQTLKKLLNEKPKVIEKHLIIEKKPRIQKQEIITVAGPGGAGKSDLLVQIAALLAKMSQAKILCVDLNTEFPSLDCFFGISRQPEEIEYFIGSGRDASLNYMVDSIDKNRFDRNTFEELVIKHKGFGNLDILTGNYSLYDCQNTLNEHYYKAILNKAKELYDFIFLDTSENVFLDSTRFAVTNATRVFFTAEPTVASIRKAAGMLDLFINSWDVSEEKINIVINKQSKYSLDKETVRQLFINFRIHSFIEYNPKHYYCLNTGQPFVIRMQEKEIQQYKMLLEQFNFIEKRSFLNKLFDNRLNKKEERIIEYREDIKC